MDRKTKLHMIDDLFAAHDAIYDQIDALKSTIDPDPGCALYEAIFGLLDVAIRATSAAIGDNIEWLEWMIYENDCGRKGHEAGRANTMRPIRTAEDILDLIEDNDANSEQ